MTEATSKDWTAARSARFATRSRVSAPLTNSSWAATAITAMSLCSMNHGWRNWGWQLTTAIIAAPLAILWTFNASTRLALTGASNRAGPDGPGTSRAAATTNGAITNASGAG